MSGSLAIASLMLLNIPLRSHGGMSTRIVDWVFCTCGWVMVVRKVAIWDLTLARKVNIFLVVIRSLKSIPRDSLTKSMKCQDHKEL